MRASTTQAGARNARKNTSVIKRTGGIDKPKANERSTLFSCDISSIRNFNLEVNGGQQANRKLAANSIPSQKWLTKPQQTY
jgi:hypothetical protein